MLRVTLVILAICSVSVSGCGSFSDTVCGPANEHVYYRGVRFDVEAVQEGGPKTVMAADIPFSAVTDTLLIPYVAYRDLTDSPRSAQDSENEARARAENRPAAQVPASSPNH